MQSRASMPDFERLSIVTATIMLAFALTQLVSFPELSLSFTFLGIVIDLFFDFSTAIIVLTVLMAAAGMDWLLQAHPEKNRYLNRWVYVRHWIVPVMTSIVIGIALNTFSGELTWWVFYLLGSMLLFAVFVAEYNVVTTEENRNPLATVGLTALSFVLYLLLAVAVFSAEIRLYIRLPLLGIGAMMVISRALFLRLGQWHTLWAFVASLIIAEIVVGFNYLPLMPMQLGLLLVGLAYALTSIITAVQEARRSWAFWGEPLTMLILMVLVSVAWGIVI
jgi:hypothetical protein